MQKNLLKEILKLMELYMEKDLNHIKLRLLEILLAIHLKIHLDHH